MFESLLSNVKRLLGKLRMKSPYAADSFDAMTTHRPYRTAFEKGYAIEEVKKFSGIQFYPLIAKTLVELYDEGSL